MCLPGRGALTIYAVGLNEQHNSKRGVKLAEKILVSRIHDIMRRLTNFCHKEKQSRMITRNVFVFYIKLDSFRAIYCD